MNQSLWVSHFSSVVSSPASAFLELKRVRALLLIKLWFNGLLWSSTQSTQNFPQSVIKWLLFFFFLNHLCVHWSSFKKLFLHELFLCLHKLTNSLAFILSQFNMSSSLGLIISIFYLNYVFVFTWKLRGHWRIINWHNFNIIVSQGVQRPEKGERD